ncbi:hypothetical protein N8586_00915 [Verrucomicrobiales bacterium]|nr:hypothetical protein [Verrucomicrobiales bacterium]
MDWMWMAILVILCTAYAYVKLLEHLSVFTINLAANFEPVYGMILAAVLLGETDDLSLGFYLGSAMIVICVLVHSWMLKRDAGQTIYFFVRVVYGCTEPILKVAMNDSHTMFFAAPVLADLA